MGHESFDQLQKTRRTKKSRTTVETQTNGKVNTEHLKDPKGERKRCVFKATVGLLSEMMRTKNDNNTF